MKLPQGFSPEERSEKAQALFKQGFNCTQSVILAFADVPADMEARKTNYAIVQEFAEKFKAANGGSIVCRELLGLDKSGQRETPMPSQRTAEYYKKRPCVQIIGEAARIVAEKLIETNK